MGKNLSLFPFHLSEKLIKAAENEGREKLELLASTTVLFIS